MTNSSLFPARDVWSENCNRNRNSEPRKPVRDCNITTPVCVPGDAEQVVQCGAQLLHAGLVRAERDGQDQTTAPVFAPYRGGAGERAHTCMLDMI